MSQVTAADLKVLIVDDHATIRAYLTQYLKRLGVVHVDHASNVQDATQKLGAVLYNVVFLDLHMPGEGGLSFLKGCRGNKKFDKVAFIVVSAESENRAVVEVLKAGATSYIVKPVQEEVLAEHVKKTLEWLGQGTPQGAPA